VLLEKQSLNDLNTLMPRLNQQDKDKVKEAVGKE
jgi:hypothetical protein